MPRLHVLICIAAVLLGSCPTSVSAMFATPMPVPVERIIASSERKLAAAPTNAEAHYTLGRAHYLAWSLKSLSIPGFARGENVDAAPQWMVSGYTEYRMQLRRLEAIKRAREALGMAENSQPPANFWQQVEAESEAMTMAGWTLPVVPEAELDAHALAGLKSLQQAIKLDPGSGLYLICLASLQEEFATRGAELNLNPDGTALPEGAKIIREVQARKWRNAAAAGYAKAYELAIADDRKLEQRPIQGVQSLVSYSAIQSYLRLAGEPYTLRGQRAEASTQPSADTDKALVAKMKGDLKKFEALPEGMVTPILFSLESSGTLVDCLAPETRVHFDLNGDGVVESRSWIKPTTALLVWDPAMTGSITSGRQLFGNVTWWLFWKDGYAALAALDDNGDGEIAGKELTGIAAWFDRNSNGISDAGEVQPIGSLGIFSLACKSDGYDASSGIPALCHATGVRFSDGRTVPSFDWIATAELPRSAREK